MPDLRHEFCIQRRRPNVKFCSDVPGPTQSRPASEASISFCDSSATMAEAFRTPPCPREGLRPPEIDQPYCVAMNSFLPERADTGRMERSSL
jgi:hypothetical protein